MGHDDPACAIWNMWARRLDFGSQHIFGALDRCGFEALARGILVGERQRRDCDGAVLVFEDEGAFATLERAADERSLAIRKHGHSADTLGAVVVSGDDDERGCRLGDEALDETVEEAHGLDRGDGTIEDITGDDESIRFVRLCCCEHLFEDMRVLGVETVVLELPPRCQSAVCRSFMEPRSLLHRRLL